MPFHLNRFVAVNQEQMIKKQKECEGSTICLANIEQPTVHKKCSWPDEHICGRKYTESTRHNFNKDCGVVLLKHFTLSRNDPQNPASKHGNGQRAGAVGCIPKLKKNLPSSLPPLKSFHWAVEGKWFWVFKCSHCFLCIFYFLNVWNLKMNAFLL